MLPKEYRLKNPKAFNATYKNHHIVSDDNICIYFGKLKTDLSFNTRIAFVVSKKIHKRAVIRNRIKRLLREVFRLILKNNQLPDIHSYTSIICVAKNNAVNASFQSLNSSVHNLCNLIGACQ